MRAYNIFKPEDNLIKDKINRLVKIGNLSSIIESEWAAPPFGTPKNDKTIQLVSDSRVLNTMIVKKSSPSWNSRCPT